MVCGREEEEEGVLRRLRGRRLVLCVKYFPEIFIISHLDYRSVVSFIKIDSFLAPIMNGV